ncbi:MAG: RNA-binding transcriptional accessory protein [Clostridiales bacterium]|nr:RNA-binding transcriptional accessory protein [Clostridiales bacterium]
MENTVNILAAEFNQKAQHIENIISLIDEGNTMPFIARYRKEMHGAMDDQLLREIYDRLQYLRNLQKRREEIISSIETQGKLTQELSKSVESSKTLAELEDIYRPFKQKRRTRATIARERGLEPLAALFFEQSLRVGSLDEHAKAYLDPEKGLETIEDVLGGANDIIAEDISDNADIRKRLRELFARLAVLRVSASSDEDSVYRLYYDFKEPVAKLQSHRILAINRGEAEGFLKTAVEIDPVEAMAVIRRQVVKPESISTAFVISAAEDAYSRLIFPSVEREIRNELTDKASEQAIKMFGANLKPLLMQPPLKNNVIMGFDPAYRTGCKIAVVDETGKVLETSVVYPTPPASKTLEAKNILTRMINTHKVTAIAIGNGTASKESEIFISDMLRELPHVSYMIVNEAGASVYSASKLAAEEFPDFDVSLRSAVSIARRLQDPLAELVKIDPKSIGVGQYQHDMPQARLDETLAAVVEDCVNAVGVDLNTASPSLLARVSGLSNTTAKNIVIYREENGAFTSRKTLLKVPKIGPKAFQQCAGFLRVPESKSYLDNTGVHPESYGAAEKILEICGYSLKELSKDTAAELSERAKELTLERVSEYSGAGIPTVEDIIKELIKPGRDPRDELPPPILRRDLLDIKDLSSGMELQGTVRNVIDFGVFVDIGVHQDGLVHISQICDRYIKHPGEVLKVGDLVNVLVLETDPDKKRISLSIKQAGKKSVDTK